jgi:hypothetical protein
MPEPTNPPSATPKLRPHPHWDSDDAAVLRRFLESDTGRRAKAWLKYWRPELLDGSHQIKTLVRSGQVKGYDDAVENLLSLIVDNPVPDDGAIQTPEYPSLDDDSKWTEDQSKRE